MDVEIERPGTFTVTLEYALDPGSPGSEYRADPGRPVAHRHARRHQGLARLHPRQGGGPEGGERGEPCSRSSRPRSPSVGLMNLRSVTLTAEGN